MLDLEQTVARLVLDHAACAAVFQRHRIDFCCGGGVTVRAAAEARSLDPEALARELEQAIASRTTGEGVDAGALATPALLAYIVARYHAPLREKLGFLRALSAKVARVHGAHNPKLCELEGAVERLAPALLEHIDDEERALFPALERGDVDHTVLLASMQRDHLLVGAMLREVRAASEDFSVPAWGCTSYRTLFAELAALERETFAHVHLENYALAPRFLAGHSGEGPAS